MRIVLAVASLLLISRMAFADIPRDPRPRPENTAPTPPKPSPGPEKNAGKACGVGAGMALLGIGVYGAWRLSKSRPATHEVAA